MFGAKKILRKEKKNKKNGFLLFGFIMENIKKSNIIKISCKFIHFKII